MPISSQHLSKANDHFAAAINHLQLALEEAGHVRDKCHMLAIKEVRVSGLIDVIRWETRIQEALLTVKCIRSAPGLGPAIRGPIPSVVGGGNSSMDDKLSGGDVMARSTSCGFKTADGRGTKPLDSSQPICAVKVQSSDRDSPPAVEA